MVSIASVRWPVVVSAAATTSTLIVIPTRPVVAVRIVARRLRFNIQTHVLVGHVLHFHHRSGDARVVEHNETEILRRGERMSNWRASAVDGANLLVVTSGRVDFGIDHPTELREALDQSLPGELGWQRTNEHLLLIRWGRRARVGSVLLLSVVRPLLRTVVLLLLVVVATGTSRRIARSVWIRWWH